MKTFVYSLAFIGVFLALTATEEARIKKLESDVKGLQTQVGLLSEGLAALEKKVAEREAAYEYPERDERSMNLLYLRYRNRIALVEGTYIKSSSLPRIVRWTGKLDEGDFGRVKGVILEILGPDELLVSIMGYGLVGPRERRPTSEARIARGEPSLPDSQTIIIKGISTEDLEKGEEIIAEVWAAGSQQYEHATGALEIIIRCVPILRLKEEFRKGITKEDFIEALDQGLVLD
ncbi:MAG: hypothetical protein AMS15_05085 [Planctomycetes bacterium DG_23]|nr:MAG: hypothetical protein AMS15_05085 [Planctomycetes bacterium DG_23]